MNGYECEDQLTEEEYAGEIQWLRERHSNDHFAQFKEDITALRRLLARSGTSGGDALLKMSLVHAVTLMETFLQDAFRKALIENEKMLENAIGEIEELKKTKFTLREFNEHNGSLAAMAIGVFNDISFHNIPKVMRLFQALIGGPLDIRIDHVSQIVAIRHDIVHRNGKTLKGGRLDLEIDIIRQVLDDVELFVDSVRIKLEPEAYRVDVKRIDFDDDVPF